VNQHWSLRRASSKEAAQREPEGEKARPLIGLFSEIFVKWSRISIIQDRGVRVQIVLLEESQFMTFQVGLVGTDGIVLASDTLIQDIEGSGRSISTTSKFDLGTGLLCCYAGDNTARLASQQCARDKRWERIHSMDELTIKDTLIEIGNSSATNMENRNGGILPNDSRVVLAAISDRLWRLDVGTKNTSAVRFVQDRSISGDIANTCRHFMNRYANDCYLRPIKELVRLAVYCVLASGEENPHGISGLEVFIVPTGKDPVGLGHIQRKELQEWFAQTSKLIGEHLTAPFIFEPWLLSINEEGAGAGDPGKEINRE
jgi:hypothetical protein